MAEIRPDGMLLTFCDLGILRTWLGEWNGALDEDSQRSASDAAWPAANITGYLDAAFRLADAEHEAIRIRAGGDRDV